MYAAPAYLPVPFPFRTVQDRDAQLIDEEYDVANA
jgi:hypothetical protein